MSSRHTAAQSLTGSVAAPAQKGYTLYTFLTGVSDPDLYSIGSGSKSIFQMRIQINKTGKTASMRKNFNSHEMKAF
jgi:hypothetical protein